MYVQGMVAGLLLAVLICQVRASARSSDSRHNTGAITVSELVDREFGVTEEFVEMLAAWNAEAQRSTT
jgi:hypothetical protein